MLVRKSEITSGRHSDRMIAQNRPLDFEKVAKSGQTCFRFTIAHNLPLSAPIFALPSTCHQRLASAGERTDSEQVSEKKVQRLLPK